MGNRLPALFSHQRPVTQFQVRDFESLSGSDIHLAYDKWLFAVNFHVDRGGFSPVMDGDFYHYLFDRAGPQGRDIRCLCPVLTFLPAFNGAYLNTERFIPAFRNEMVADTAFVV